MSSNPSVLGLNTRPFVVLKFGGTSVATRSRWDTIGALVQERLAQGERPVVVCSALTGVSNLLQALPALAAQQQHAENLREVVHRHEALAQSMELALSDRELGLLDDLQRWVHGISWTGEAGPGLQARVLAVGELLASSLGARYLQASAGLHADWIDVRDWLVAGGSPEPDPRRRYLSATCTHEPDAKWADAWQSLPASALVTQGFIARDRQGATVLLGRGGSDTSAAYIAARLAAVRCEIWTDVPGMFTADPRWVPEARHLRQVDFDEAQEIATTGSRVLHPRSIAPCRDNGIPMVVRSTLSPELPGTTIAAAGHDQPAGVKAVSVKSGVQLVSMDTLGMWQQVGFLAEVFACFSRSGLSIDLVSTSETNVTVSLDPSANVLEPGVLDGLVESLRPWCRARLVGPCTAISLVGSRLRSVFSRLAPAFALFEEQRVYLVSQAASDLNLSFVIDSEHAQRLVQQLHELLFRDEREGRVFGPTWQDLQRATQPVAESPRWWRRERDRLLDIAAAGTPVYVYHAHGVREAARSLRALPAVSRIFYALKANAHPELLRTLHAEGIGFECVSPGELARAFDAVPGLSPDRVLFTPNFAPIDDYRQAFELGVHVNVDNLFPLLEHPEVFAGRDILVRVDPGAGRGHHAHVRTAGVGSKFGILPDDLPRVAEVIRAIGARVIGLHAHAGSGILSASHWQQTATVLAEQLQHFPDVQVLDVGGGLGVVERTGQTALNLEAVGAGLQAIRDLYPHLELWIEPGRFLIATSGVLLARVTQTKEKGGHHWVGIDAGMQALIRPALYGAWHPIVNLSRVDEPAHLTASVVGPICESGDTLGIDRRLPECRENDVMLIDVAGAYGFTMASHYNLRSLPRELWFSP